jgi:hypothetical protein
LAGFSSSIPTASSLLVAWYEVYAMSAYLMTVDLSSLPSMERTEFLGRVLEIAIQLGSRWFTLEERVVSRGRAGSARGAIEKRELAGVKDLVVSSDTFRRAVNVYSNEGWVAGLSDWGDDVSIRLDRSGRECMLNLVDEYDGLPWDLVVVE